MAAKKKQPKPVYQTGNPCTKCGSTEYVTQLRKVAVDVGWKMTQMHAVAPCAMCAKCGNLTVAVSATVGDLAGLVPDPDMQAPKPQAKKVAKKTSKKKPKR